VTHYRKSVYGGAVPASRHVAVGFPIKVFISNEAKAAVNLMALYNCDIISN
jgi:hypothetical protein